MKCFNDLWTIVKSDVLIIIKFLGTVMMLVSDALKTNLKEVKATCKK